MKERILLSTSLTLLLIASLIHPVGIEAKTQSPYLEESVYPYPKVNITGSGTLTSNVTARSLRVSFDFAGIFWTEQQVTIPKLNVSSQAAVYNITGTLTVEGETQMVVGIFANATFDFKTRNATFFIISVQNSTTEQLTFSALAPRKLLVTLPPGRGAYARYGAALAAILVDSDYPNDFFLTKPPRFLSATFLFPK